MKNFYFIFSLFVTLPACMKVQPPNNWVAVPDGYERVIVDGQECFSKKGSKLFLFCKNKK